MTRATQQVLTMKLILLWVVAACSLAGCASMFDTPQVVLSESSDHKDRLHVWSSGSAAAIGMSNTDAPPNFCVLGAAFARTGTTSTGVSVVLPGGKSADVSSSGTAGALLIKNEGQTATYLDTGLFHLCMLYAQGLITEQQDRADLIKALFTASGDVAKSATQFATVPALQPASPDAPAPKAKPPAAPADAASAPAASAPAATAASGVATENARLQLNMVNPFANREKPTAEESRRAAADQRAKQNASRQAQSARPNAASTPASGASAPK